MKAVYPGSFDPCTNGHIDIIERASAIFDELIVIVASNSEKKHIFSAEQRIDFLKCSTSHLANVKVVSCDGLVAQYVKDINAQVIVKGLRTCSDFEYEFQIANVNRHLNEQAETVFMPTNPNNIFLSSSVVRELLLRGGNIVGLVPKCIEKDIIKNFE